MPTSRNILGALVLQLGVFLLLQSGQQVDRGRTAMPGLRYDKTDPFGLIAQLVRSDERGETTLHVPDAPADWIDEADLELLVRLLDSDEPCAGIHSLRDSRIYFGEDPRPRSTVGHEAGYLILGYRHGRYPKGATFSVEWTVDRDEIRRWWRERREGGDTDERAR